MEAYFTSVSESALSYHERYAGYFGQELLECQHKLISEDLYHHCSCVSKAGHCSPDLWERMQRTVTTKAHYLPAQTGMGAAVILPTPTSVTEVLHRQAASCTR